jgi:cellulose synthase/poly-beta-1,6-N-acetylglucosamine synthase-like glycosyltransferase
MDMISIVFFTINVLILIYFAAINGVYLILIILSYFSVVRYHRLIRLQQWRRVIQSPTTIPVTIIAPAYNEEVTIVESVKSLLALQYPLFETVVVNDGSKDETLETLKSAFNLRQVPAQLEEKVKCQKVLGVYRSTTNPNLVVVDKTNGGKADALNAGLNVSRYPLFCAIDADSLLEGNALLRVTHPFLEKPHTTVAAGGIIRVANGCHIEGGRVLRVGLAKNWLAVLQTVEYLRAFLFGRMGWDAIRSLLIISGAFGVFKKNVVIEAGGYSHDSIGEDMELVVRIHRLLREQGRRYEMHFLPDPVCWTEVPESLKILARQRNRWHRGLVDSLQRHRKMFLNPRYGTIGMIAFPYFVFFEMLGPVVELSGYIIVPLSYAFGILNLQFFFLFLSLAILLGVVLSTGSVVLEEISFRRYPHARDILKLVAVGILENFGYRQIHTWWRFTGMVDYFRKKTAWGKMERKGFSKV